MEVEQETDVVRSLDIDLEMQTDSDATELEEQMQVEDGERPSHISN